MARLLRWEQAGAWYHITARGNERRSIYRDDRDRGHFLELLEDWLARHRLRLYAYVLMDNHYHLLLMTQEPNLSRAMQWLNTSYSVWFNRRHQRVGHVFQGRFKAVIVEPVTWALGLSRYIHLNPVRVKRLGLDKTAQRSQRQGAGERPDPDIVAKRLDQLRQNRWSSYRAYGGWEKAPKWLDCETVLALGGGRARERRQRYRQYVESAVREGLVERPWEAIVERMVLGSREFIKELMAEPQALPAAAELERKLAPRPTFAQVRKAVERVKGEAWEKFADRHGDWGRDLALWLGRDECGLTLSKLGEAVGQRSAMAVSMALKRLEMRLTTDKTLLAALAKARKRLNHDAIS